jgi:hypothetical protein
LGDTRELGEADEGKVSVQLFIIAFGIGATILAVWADFRFAAVRPGNLYSAMLHVGLAMLLARFIVPLGMHLVGNLTTPLAGIFLVGLPACVYCLLACLWVMRQIGDMVGKASQGPDSGHKA